MSADVLVESVRQLALDLLHAQHRDNPDRPLPMVRAGCAEPLAEVLHGMGWRLASPARSDRDPVPSIRRTGKREVGLYAWEAWVDCGLTRYAGEFGTYAWTRSGAERKARRLHRRYLSSRPGSTIRLRIADPSAKATP